MVVVYVSDGTLVAQFGAALKIFSITALDLDHGPIFVHSLSTSVQIGEDLESVLQVS
jgi:hypothetical protein